MGCYFLFDIQNVAIYGPPPSAFPHMDQAISPHPSPLAAARSAARHRHPGTLSALGLFLLVVAVIPPRGDAQSPPARKRVQLNPVNMTNWGGNVFQVADSEINANGSLVKRVELGKSSAVLTYANRGRVGVKPDFTIHLFNAYGMEIASITVSWLLQKVEPGEVQKEDVKFTVLDLYRMFTYSDLELPANWSQITYAVFEGNAI